MRATSVHYLILALSFSAGGCGENAAGRVPVAGKVLIDGQPLTRGLIRFVPEAGRPASSAILADGSFELAAESVDRQIEKGVPPGTYRVQVSASKIVDDKNIEWAAPQHYADFRTSGLTLTIDKPTNELLIKLTNDSSDPTQDDSDLVEQKKSPLVANESIPTDADRDGAYAAVEESKR